MNFEHFADAKYCLLTTYRTSGAPVPTPVWFVNDGSSILVCSDDPSGKVHRIRRDPRVEVRSCTFRGRSIGPAAAGAARILAGTDAAQAARAMHASYSVGKRLYYRVAHPLVSRGKTMVFIRIDPVPSPAG